MLENVVINETVEKLEKPRHFLDAILKRRFSHACRRDKAEAW